MILLAWWLKFKLVPTIMLELQLILKLQLVPNLWKEVLSILAAWIVLRSHGFSLVLSMWPPYLLLQSILSMNLCLYEELQIFQVLMDLIVNLCVIHPLISPEAYSLELSQSFYAQHLSSPDLFHIHQLPF